jgi:hypothetical protein
MCMQYISMYSAVCVRVLVCAHVHDVLMGNDVSVSRALHVTVRNARCNLFA